MGTLLQLGFFAAIVILVLAFPIAFIVQMVKGRNSSNKSTPDDSKENNQVTRWSFSQGANNVLFAPFGLNCILHFQICNTPYFILWCS